MQHGTETEDQAGALKFGGVGVLGLVHVGDGLGQGAIVAEAAGEDEGDSGLDAFVEDAAGEAAGGDRLPDSTALVDGVDGAHVVAMAVLLLASVAEAQTERGAEEGGFHVVDA